MVQRQWCDLLVAIQVIAGVPANVKQWNGTAAPRLSTPAAIPPPSPPGEIGGGRLCCRTPITAAVIADNAVDLPMPAAERQGRPRRRLGPDRHGLTAAPG
jgi:hypothetical protein